MAPLPKARPKLVRPSPGETSTGTRPTTCPPTPSTAPADDTSLPKPTGPASAAPSRARPATPTPQNLSATTGHRALQRRRAAAARGARGGPRRHPRRQHHRPLAVQVGRRPRPLPGQRLRLQRLGLLRALLRGPDRRPARLRRPDGLRQARQGQVDHAVRQRRPRVHGGRRHPLRHHRRGRDHRLSAGRTSCAATAATRPATRRGSS